MLLTDVVVVPTAISLAAVAAILAASMVASKLRPQEGKAEEVIGDRR